MSRQRDNDKLDDLIFGAINTEKPQFDAEKWKQKYPDEYQALISRKDKPALSRQPNILRVILGKPAVQLAAAAAVIAVVGLLMVYQNPPEQQPPQPFSIAKSPVEILTVASLNIAYRKGGLEAVEAQFEKALNKPQPTTISVQELLEDLNG